MPLMDRIGEMPSTSVEPCGLMVKMAIGIGPALAWLKRLFRGFVVNMPAALRSTVPVLNNGGIPV
jgi:hypothetical protein